jgi:hypothetical protein
MDSLVDADMQVGDDPVHQDAHPDVEVFDAGAVVVAVACHVVTIRRTEERGEAYQVNNANLARHAVGNGKIIASHAVIAVLSITVN